MRNKVSIIGAGHVGIDCARRIVEPNYADVVLLGRREGLCRGKALDIMESAPIIGFDSRIIGTSHYEDTAKSDVVVISAGIPRPPNITSREDMLAANANIIEDIIPRVINTSPDSIIIICTNPTEPLTYLALRLSKFPRNRIFGLSGVTDSARLSSFIAAELNVSVQDVSACILGQHGQEMVVIPRYTTVCGTPITELLPPDAIKRLIQRTIRGGWEINSLIKENHAWSIYTPSAGLARMVEAIILDSKKIISCATYLQGEYGIKDTVIGVPVKLGRNGIEQVIELKLTPDEQSALAKSAKTVRGIVGNMKWGNI